jgi:hypothetical protein
MFASPRNAARLFAFRRWCSAALGTRSRLGSRAKVLFATAIFVCSFAVRSLHAVDLSALMYTTDQPRWSMTEHYDLRGVSIVGGHGLLFPDDRRKVDTSLMAFSAGYSIYVGAVYYLFGRNYFPVQLVQNLLSSLCPVLLFLISGELISWRVGVTAGLLTAVYHGMAFYSNFLLPDPLAPLLILAAAYFLVRAWVHRRRSYVPFLEAGVALGISFWLRPNGLLLGPFALVVLVLVYDRWRSILPRAAVMVAVSWLVVSPVTIRNYVMFGAFVPVWLGVGTELWQGIGEASGGGFGAAQSDEEIGAQEAVLYGDRHYVYWASPDGVWRDRARVNKSIAVVIHHPLFFVAAMLERMRTMLRYSAQADMVIVRPSSTPESGTAPSVPSKAALAPGELLFWLRRPVKALERVVKETTLLFVILGAIATFLLSRRRWLMISVVPAYYFIFQSTMHSEFRYIITMHYFLFIFSAVTWCLVIHAGASAAARLFNGRSEHAAVQVTAT